METIKLTNEQFKELEPFVKDFNLYHSLHKETYKLVKIMRERLFNKIYSYFPELKEKEFQIGWEDKELIVDNKK